MGQAFKELGLRRESLVVSTKIFKCGSGINDTFLSRKHIIEGIKNSLRRLQFEYVDVVFCHRPDFETPLEETVRAMHWVIENNLAFYWVSILRDHSYHKMTVKILIGHERVASGQNRTSN